MIYFSNIIICIIDRHNNNSEMGKNQCYLEHQEKTSGGQGALRIYIARELR